MDIETRLANLENLVEKLNEKIEKIKFYHDSDISGTRQEIAEDAEYISDNSNGLFDVASLADENSQAIMDLAEIISEMEGN